MRVRCSQKPQTKSNFFYLLHVILVTPIRYPRNTYTWKYPFNKCIHTHLRMKLSLAITAVMTSLVSAQDYWYNLQFEPCEGSVDPALLVISIPPNTLVDIGATMQTTACKLRVVSVSPGINPDNVQCNTYSEGNDGNTSLFISSLDMKGGVTWTSPPFRGVFCGGG